jgi:hypothetical protein
VWKISPPPGFDPRTVQNVASDHTDWATRPTFFFNTNYNIILQFAPGPSKWFLPSRRSITFLNAFFIHHHGCRLACSIHLSRHVDGPIVFLTGKMAHALTFLSYNRQFTGSNISLDTGYSMGFHAFSQPTQANAGIVPSIRLCHLSFTSLQWISRHYKVIRRYTACNRSHRQLPFV